MYLIAYNVLVFLTQDVDVFLQKMAKIAQEKGVTPELKAIKSHSPKTAIMKYAEISKADMIVCGTHGRGAMGRFFIGSVASYLVHNAKCPVTVVRPPPKSPAAPASKAEASTAQS